MSSETTGLSGWVLLLVRVGTMVAISCLSFYLVERPLRRADWSTVRRLHLPVAGVASLGVAVTAGIIVIGTVGPPLAETAPVPRARPTAASGAADLVHATLPTADPSHPYRAWILGDSVMEGGSLGHCGGTAVHRRSVGGGEHQLGGLGIDHRARLGRPGTSDPDDRPSPDRDRHLVVGRAGGARRPGPLSGVDDPVPPIPAGPRGRRAAGGAPPVPPDRTQHLPARRGRQPVGLGTAVRTGGGVERHRPPGGRRIPRPGRLPAHWAGLRAPTAASTSG